MIFDPENKILYLSNSVRSSFDTCRQKYYYEYIYENAGLEPVLPASPLRLGSAMHLVLMHHHSGMPIPAAIDAGLAMYDKLMEDPNIVVDAKLADAVNKERAIVEGFLPAYSSYWEIDDSDTKLVGAEIDLTLPIGNINGWSVVYTGRLDLITESLTDRSCVVMDHKTLSMFRAPYFNRLHFDYQLTGYAVLAERYLDRPISRIVYNCIRKPALRQKMHETKPEFITRIIADYSAVPETYFKRVEVIRTSEQIKEFYSACAQAASDIISCYENGLYRRNMTTCDIYNGCPFSSMCVSSMIDLVNFRTKTQRKEVEDVGDVEW